MKISQRDTFLNDVLREARPSFAFVADPAYHADLPAALVWVMIRALVSDKGLTVNEAARMVLDYIERNSATIRRILGCPTVSELLEQEDAKEKRRRAFAH